MKVTKLSPAKHEALAKELEYLKTTRQAEVVEAIKAARAYGDLSENSEYDEAKEEQSKLFARIAELEGILSNCEIVEESRDTSAVRTGCRVTVQFDGDDPEEYTLVGSQEVDISKNWISEESLVGKAMVGLKVGDKGVVDAPAGKLSFKVLEINI